MQQVGVALEATSQLEGRVEGRLSSLMELTLIFTHNDCLPIILPAAEAVSAVTRVK